MGSCMVEKFKYFIDLDKDEEKLLLTLEEKTEQYKSGDIIRSKGSNMDDIHVISSGWTFTSSNIDKDIRTIFDIRLDGDFAGIGEISYCEYIYDLVALTDVEVCPFPKGNLNDIFQKSEKLCRTFYAILSREHMLMSERVISLGRRTAIEKVAHLILEMRIRMDSIGCSDAQDNAFPMTQNHIADILGLSSVQVSRSMNELRNNKYIKYSSNELTILEKDKLYDLALFPKNFNTRPNTDWHTK